MKGCSEMNHYKIIPIASKEEKTHFVKRMYCQSCKESGGCSIQESETVLEEGYQYEKTNCYCHKCSDTFSIMFFNENSQKNLSLKKLQKIVDSFIYFENEED